MTQSPPQAGQPSELSVVICIYNRYALLREALNIEQSRKQYAGRVSTLLKRIEKGPDFSSY